MSHYLRNLYKMAQMYDSYLYKSVDTFDLSMGMNGQENGDAYMDHTFHTPSFGDEEFDIPPINLPPTTPSSDTNSSDVYGSTHPLSHQEPPTHSPPQQQPPQQQQQPTSSSSNNNNHQQQQHMMSPPPQMSPVPPSYSPHQQQCVSSTMTSSASTSPMMTSFSPHHHHQQMQQQFQQQPMHHHHHHQQQQQQQQQNHPYGNQQDMYMLQIAPGNMMPPHSTAVQFHVQQYSIPNYSSPMQQQQMHMHHQVPQHHHHHQMHHPYHEQQLPMMGPPPRHKGPGSTGSSPPGSNHTSPGLETSEDSDDSGQHLTQLMCGMKRPSPEPIERPPSGGKNVKKPKVQKKKKKRDPNEPQKPVSAYALFFRDTQAAIKGQNPNASFGEVSKIVASMWDGLDVDHKNVYKKKTEAAKKEYLKALAAYRASLVSRAANDQSDNIYGGPSPPAPSSSLSPLQKKSPLLTSLMEGTPVSMNNQSMIMGHQSPMGGIHHSHVHHTAPPTHQILHQMLSPGAQQQMMRMGSGSNASSPPPHPMMQQHHGIQQQNNNNNSVAYTPNMSQQMPHPGSQQQQQGMMQNGNCQPRNDNPQLHQEWERDYSQNDCVVSHCRDVFSTWVASRPQQNSYASVK